MTALTKDQQAALNADLPRSEVKERQGFSYVEGHAVIDRLNAIIGCGCWSYDTEPRLITRENTKDAKGRYLVSYNAKCVLRVGDAVIGDWGTGHGIDPDEGKSHESAIKEACTDALKRCAKSLGRRMGLALYEKAQTHVTDDALLAAVERARADLHSATTLDALKAKWTAVVKDLEPFITTEVYSELESRKDASKARLSDTSRSLPPRT